MRLSPPSWVKVSTSPGFPTPVDLFVSLIYHTGCTAKAVSHQIANMRKIAKEAAGTTTTTTSAPGTPKQPRKRTKPKPEAEEEEDEDGETPAKQAKKTAAAKSTKAKSETASEAAVKEETGDEDGVEGSGSEEN